MQATKQTEEVAFDALREMYQEAEPPADFDEILENPDEQPDDWFSQHKLADERQREIVDKHCEKHNLNDKEYSAVVWTAILNYGPVGHTDKE